MTPELDRQAAPGTAGADTPPRQGEMSQPHLVVKRGHLGRYRFTLLTDHGRVSGEVRIETDGSSRAEQDAAARAEVRRIATALVAAAAEVS